MPTEDEKGSKLQSVLKALRACRPQGAWVPFSQCERQIRTQPPGAGGFLPLAARALPEPRF